VFVAIHIHLGEHREADLVVQAAKLRDLGFAPRLLAAELVAGKAEHRQATLAILAPQGFKPLVLGREAATAGDIDEQQYPALAVLHRTRGTIQGLGRELVERAHHFSSSSVTA
jgi:hypothetical protein